MSDFDLRKFLAEQKAAKIETIKEEGAVEEVAVQEEAIEEVETQEEAVEETYHEGEEMEEGDMDESVIAGIAALVGSSLAAAKVLDWIKSKYPEAVEKFVKGAEAGMRGSGKLEEELDEAEISEEVNEEELKESTFKASIKEILNS